MARTNSERETIINFNEAEKTANVCTFNPSLKRKLGNYADERPDECKFIQDLPEGAVEYEVPKKWVKVTPPRTVNMTDEQKKVLTERLHPSKIDSDGE